MELELPDRRHRQSPSSLPTLVLAAIAFVIALNMYLGHFYVQGGYYLDSGWFVWLSSNSTPNSMPNAPGIGGNFYPIHVSPIFWVFTIASKTIFAPFPEAARFAIYQSLFHAAWVAALVSAARRYTSTWLAGLMSFAVAFSGLSLAVVAFPHHEIAIPIMLACALSLWSRPNTSPIFGFLALAVGLAVREDAGLHYGGFFVLVGLVLLRIEGRRRLGSQAIALAGVASFYSVAVLVWQSTIKTPNTGSSLSRVFLGSPPYEHLSVELMVERLQEISTTKAFITIPLAMLLVWLTVKKDWLTLAGVASVMPWFAFCFLAISDLAGLLDTYYVFPLLTALSWPILSPNWSMGSTSLATPVVAALCGVLSLGLTAVPESLQIKVNPVRNLDFDWVERVDGTQDTVDLISHDAAQIGPFYVDDALASLMTASETGTYWAAPGVATVDGMDDAECLFLMQDTWQEYSLWLVANESGIVNWQHFPDSRVQVGCRTERADLTELWGLVPAQ